MDQSALFALSYGLYAVGVQGEGRLGGRILDAFVQVAGGEEPVVVAGFMNTGHSVAAIRESGAFTVSVLPEDVHPFVIGNFGFQSGANADKWSAVPHTLWHALPILNDAISYLYCSVLRIEEYPTHTVVTASVTDAQNGRKAQPLLYADYHKGLKAKAQTAFSDFTESGKAPGKNLCVSEQWVCTLCGYVYDGETPFEQLPEDWICPLCGSGKFAFEARATQPQEQKTDPAAPAAITAEQWVCTLCGYVYDGETPFEALPEDWCCPLCGAPKSAFERQ